ncbi:MAG: hypothetical protein ACI9P3_003516 [Bradyrhizobium sp.]
MRSKKIAYCRPIVARKEIAMKLGWKPQKWLEKKSKSGFRGYLVGTVAFYGPDNLRASKVAVAVVTAEGAPPFALRRWFSETGDVRHDPAIMEEIATFLRAEDVRTVASVPTMMGCPHEEGIDYPQGEVCPQCPYWANRERPLSR